MSTALRTIKFSNVEVFQTRMTDEQLAHAYGWKMIFDATRGERIFQGWKWEAIECSDGEMVRVNYTAAVSNAKAIVVYDDENPARAGYFETNNDCKICGGWNCTRGNAHEKAVR